VLNLAQKNLNYFTLMLPARSLAIALHDMLRIEHSAMFDIPLIWIKYLSEMLNENGRFILTGGN
jgi:hypothetical protein